MKRPYQQRPRQCSRALRSLVVSRFPALTEHPNGHAFFKMLQYILYGTLTDKETGRPLLPYTLVADLVGVGAHSRGFSAERWSAEFEAHVFALHPTQHRYVDGQARMISPEVPADILEALRQDRLTDDRADWVWFTDGATVSRRQRQRALADHEDALVAVARSVDKDHPAAELLDYLTTQPQDCLQRVLRRNWPHLKEALFNLPVETPRQRATRDWSERVVDDLHEFGKVYYTDTERSPRLFALGTTIHMLPSDLRRVALGGQVELDLRACQLAIVSKLWDVPALHEFLSVGRCIWTELLTWIGVPAEHKGVLKMTVYGIVFGMSRRRLRRQLSQGTPRVDGVGAVAAASLFEHPLVEELLRARSVQMQRVWDDRGAVDAFGRWITADWDAARRRRNCPRVLARVVQSWELRVMLAMLPVFQAERQLTLLSWLHDGVTVHLGDSTKAERHLRKLCGAVQREVNLWGFPTGLEVKHLPSGGDSCSVGADLGLDLGRDLDLDLVFDD